MERSEERVARSSRCGQSSLFTRVSLHLGALCDPRVKAQSSRSPGPRPCARRWLKAPSAARFMGFP